MLSIDVTTCNGCGLCGTICPRRIPVTQDGRTRVSEERAGLCLDCGHCAAVCPTESVTVDGMAATDFEKLEESGINERQMAALLRQRRSVRRYSDRTVPSDMLARLVEAAHAAPTGTGRACTSLLVLRNRKRIDEMMALVYEQYAALEKALRNPVARIFIRREAGPSQFAVLRDFVMPAMAWDLRWYREGKGDEISRDCPVLLLFHGPSREPQMNDNCTLAAFHSILMAETLGLGTCFNHLIPAVVGRSRELREMLEIPEENEAYAAVTLGFPRYRWKRSVPRRLADVRIVD